MWIRKAKQEEASIIAPIILLAMEDIVYSFIGEKSKKKAVSFMSTMISQPHNQYSYQNAYVGIENEKIISAAIVYDGSRLPELRKPVADEICQRFNRDFHPEDETEPGEYYIDSIGVHPDFQGKGFGTEFFRFLIEEYVLNAGQTLGLLVDKDNPAAKKLYLKLGFRYVKDKILEGKEMEHLQIRRDY